MRIKPREYKFQDGRILTVRSVEGKDAEAHIQFKHTTSGETHFMARYPEEECSYDDMERVREGLTTCEASPVNFEIGVYDDRGEQVGGIGVTQVRPHIKYRHRAVMGISILKKYWGCGLGSFLMQLAVEQAAANGFEQLELGVFEDNVRAIHLYEKFGFAKYGVSPRAFKLKDGTYRDEIIMVRMLK